MSKIDNNPNANSNILLKIRSRYILSRIFDNLNEVKCLKVILYNKNLLRRLDKNINNYKKEYFKTEIEINLIPKENQDLQLIKHQFINIETNKESYFHIYFDDNKEEVKRNYITKDDKVSKIKVIIDSKFKSFSKLFQYCENIKKINFLKFNRTDIKDMSYMFNYCRNLEELNFLFFKTDNVIKMNNMFDTCKCLKKLNLSKFNTSNVTNMSSMFSNCTSLEELNISNFNTNKVTNMSFLFYLCTSLKELNITNFKTNNVTNMSNMFTAKLNKIKKLY